MMGIIAIFGVIALLTTIFFAVTYLDTFLAFTGLSQTSELNAILFGGVSTILSIITIIFVGIISLQNQRAIARRKATIDLIHDTHKDEIFEESLVIFVNEAKKGNLKRWALEENEGSKETLAIRTVLNQYEIVSLGIENGIYDEDLYKQWFKRGVILYWDYAKPFVEEIRVRRFPKAFTEFEKLSKRYKKEEEERSNKLYRFYKTNFG